jgi:membrane-associated phospholipid phosphatase
MNWKEQLRRNKHILFILYCPLYLYCFQWLEARDNVAFTDIHCVIDDWIPFCEIFVIPYVLWFVYVAAVILYLYLQRKHLEDYYRCAVMLILGMSTCLLIYYLFPNEQNLRPSQLAHKNILTDIIQFIYASDTNTNVLPSIHVYNAITIHFAFATSHGFRKKYRWRIASLILCSLICLSTMFLKQHSLLDVLAGLGLFLIYSLLVYQVYPVWKSKMNKGNASTLP